MIPAPDGIRVTYTLETKDGGKYFQTEPVVAFDDDGTPLVPYEWGLTKAREVHTGAIGWRLENLELLPQVPAAPGWYALFAEEHDGEQRLERSPIVAWRGTTSSWGSGSAIVIVGDDEGRPRPMDADAYANELDNVRLLGFHHPEHLPESRKEQR